MAPSASKGVVFGISEARLPSSSRRRPERTRALILTGTFSFTGSRTTWTATLPSCGRAWYLSWVSYALDAAARPMAELGRAARSAGSGATLRGLLLGAVDTPARHVGAHERQPGHGARHSHRRSRSTCGRSCR